MCLYVDGEREQRMSLPGVLVIKNPHHLVNQTPVTSFVHIFYLALHMFVNIQINVDQVVLPHRNILVK